MHIVVNGRFVTQSLTGVQRYARQIVEALGETAEVELLIPGGAHNIGPIPPGVHTVRTIGKRSGHLWEQLDLPSYLHKKGSPLLLNLGNTAPVRYQNQLIVHHDITYVRCPDTYSWRFRMTYLNLAKYILPRARAVVTVSEFSKREISSYFQIPPGRIHVVPNAPTVFPPSGPAGSGAAYFLAVGSLLRHKNHAVLIDAYSAFKDMTGSETRLIIVGGTVSAGAGQKISELRTSGLEFIGRVSDSELGTLYANSRAFVSPSKYEGFGLPTLEAQFAGCPVIAADIEVARETLKDSAEFFDANSSIALAELLSKVDGDSTMRDRMSAAGKLNAQRYSWARSGVLMREIIAQFN